MGIRGRGFYQPVFVSFVLVVGVDLELTEPGQQRAVVPVGQVGVENRGQRQGARHHPKDGQDPGQAQAGAAHGHCQLNTESGQGLPASKYHSTH